MNVRLFVADTVADLTFWAPFWLVVDLLTGISLSPAFWAVVFGSVVSLPFGRAYGKYLDCVRRKLVG